MEKKLRSKVIDGEGIKTTKKNLIEEGRLNFFFNCLSTARQINEDPTGHGSRSVSSIPSASYSNLYLENGNIDKKDMIGSLKKGIIVTELMGSSINLSNGDYSRGASGFWVENGKVAYPVSEITIAGNLKDIFLSIVPANDLEFNFGINAPSLFIKNLTVGGNLIEKGLDDELKNFCEFAITEAGKIALSLQKNLKISYKSKNQPVTNADIEIDQFLFSFFQQKTPNFGWLSEESVDNKSRQKSDFFWCLDPIDGTRSYISGKPEYTISLALIKESQPILGIIYNPVTNEYFTAEKKGAFVIEKELE